LIHKQQFNQEISMKKSTLILGLAVLIFVSAGFECSFTTANISSFVFSKSDKGDPAITSANTGDKVFAVATVSNTSGKHKVVFKVFYENVAGKAKGEEAYKDEIPFEGARPIYLGFTPPAGGDYKVEATLFDDAGKQIDQKSGTLNVKGGAAAPPASTTSDDKDDDK
jgi:hypothetical protein